MMPDKEKVIKGLECCEREECSSDCPYWNGSIIDASCITKAMGDAIALLKEQPEIVWCKDCKNNIGGRCSNLDLWVETDPEWFCADGKQKKGR